MKMNFLELGVGKGNQFWKYLFVMIFAWAIGAGLFGFIPLIVTSAIIVDQSNGDWSSLMDFEAIGMSLNLGLFLILLSFAIGLVMFLGAIWFIHNKRTYKETINGTKKVRWNRVWVGVCSWGILKIIFYSFALITNPENYVLQFDIATFIPLLFIVLLFIPLQTTFEELTFRGYLAQGLAGLTKSRWVAFLIPSTIFGLMHMANPEVAEHGFWIMMPQYIFVGLVWGLISILDDGIELAIGAHAINNVFLALFFTHSASALQTNAVFQVQEINPVGSLISLIVFSTIFVYVLWRIYKWDFSILNKRVEKQEEDATENEQNNTIRPQF